MKSTEQVWHWLHPVNWKDGPPADLRSARELWQASVWSVMMFPLYLFKTKNPISMPDKSVKLNCIVSILIIISPDVSYVAFSSPSTGASAHLPQSSQDDSVIFCRFRQSPFRWIEGVREMVCGVQQFRSLGDKNKPNVFSFLHIFFFLLWSRRNVSKGKGLLVFSHDPKIY